ncbi:MAG: hypothetical protein SGI77_04345 [Pirellulaceae bacterium]|nr:hypothetical protein [Pirellulaceae bacterium]
MTIVDLEPYQYELAEICNQASVDIVTAWATSDAPLSKKIKCTLSVQRRLLEARRKFEDARELIHASQIEHYLKIIENVNHTIELAGFHIKKARRTLLKSKGL